MEYTQNQIKRLVDDACKGEKESIAIILGSYEVSNNETWVLFWQFVFQLLRNSKNFIYKDNDIRDEIIERTFNRLINVFIDIDRNPIAFIKRVYFNETMSFAKSKNQQSLIAFDEIFETTEFSEQLASNKTFGDQILDSNKSNADSHFEMFANFSQLKYDLYFNGSGYNYVEELVQNNLVSLGETPILYGNFKNTRSLSIHNLKHQLWRNFNYSERCYMEAAIDQMQLSKSQNRPGKPDPIVGGVLVDEFGDIVAYSHRGEFGNKNGSDAEFRMLGDHCEFNLLTKKVTNIDLSKCKLYVTLEPCSKRGPTKTPCAIRVAESGIKKICIGMLDPDKEIYDNGINILLNAGFDITFFHNDLTEKIKNHPLMLDFINSRVR